MGGANSRHASELPLFADDVAHSTNASSTFSPSYGPVSSSSVGWSGALSLVSVQPIAAFAPFWQTHLARLSFSALSDDADAVADALERAAGEMARNTHQSGNLRTMLRVLAMALEQYPQVVRDAQMQAKTNAQAKAGATSPPSSAEPLCAFFARVYGSSSSGPRLPPPVSSPADLRRASQSPPPDWLLNLIFLARIFLRHVVAQTEYGPRRTALLSLRPSKSLGPGYADRPPPTIHRDLSYRLVHALLSALTDLPLTRHTYELHLELSLLLLTLASAQAYVPLARRYARDTPFLAHALLGPIARRSPETAAKLLESMVHAAEMTGTAAASDATGGAARGAQAADPSSPAPLSVSAMTSPPDHTRSDTWAGNVSPMSPIPAQSAASPSSITSSSLSARLSQLGVVAGGHGSILKRLGSRLVSLLLLPVHLYRYFFAARGGSRGGLSADPLAVASGFLLLLLTHQSLDSFRTPPAQLSNEGDEEDEVVYEHAKETEFDLALCSDETDPEPEVSRPSQPPPTTAAAVGSTARPAAPLHVRVASESSLTSVGDATKTHCPSGMNPYKHALSLLADDAWDDGAEDDAPTPVSALTPSSSMSPLTISLVAIAAPRPTVSFAALYSLLTASRASESSTLLLYTLLHTSDAFREFILVKSDIDLLVVPWLEILYEEYAGGGVGGGGGTSHSRGRASALSSSASSMRSNRVYMLLILLLMVSSDRGFVEHIHRRLILKRVPFYTDAHLAHISLGSAVMLVLLRVIQSNLFHPRDAYVHTNCLAILSNLAHSTDPVPPSATVGISDPIATTAVPATAGGIKLHPTVCLKLVALLSVLSKKYAKYLDCQQRESQHRSNGKDVPASASRNSASVAPTSTPPPPVDASRINLAPPSSIAVALQAPIADVTNGKPVPSSAATAMPESNTPTSSNGFGAAHDAPPSSTGATAGDVEDLSSFSSFIRLLLDLLTSFLSPAHISSNVYLLYSLLQSASVLEPFRHHPELCDTAGEMRQMCAHFQGCIEAAQRKENGESDADARSTHLHRPLSSHQPSSLSVEALMTLLKAEVRTYRVVTHSIGHTQFSYEDKPRAEEFFVPYVWYTVHQYAEVLPFNEQRVVIFNTGEEEDEEEDDSDGEGASTDARSATASSTSASATSLDSRRLAADLEQLHAEHALHKQLGADHAAAVASALATPLATPNTRSVIGADARSAAPESQSLAASTNVTSNARIERGTE